MTETVVSEFYSGKSVLITGGTGFLGKVLIEKLLYSCTGIDKIYVLVRNTSKCKGKDKLEKLLNSQAFTRIKSHKPQVMDKIISVLGDVTLPNLGISSEDEETLLEKVSVVFHLVASIQFNDPIKDALLLNVEGTRKMLELCKRMKRIQAFVHVSTAYSNMVQGSVVEEVVYPPPASLEQLYKCLKNGQVEEVKQNMMSYPNTYTFSKALAETLVADEHGSLPVVIIRPSIVMPSKTEPVEGWVDSWQGCLTMMTAIAKGWIRVVPGVDTVIYDFIPVDYVTNMTIVAASKCKSSREVPVYHCCSSDVNPIRFRDVSTFFIEEGVKNGFNVIPWPSVNTIQHTFIFNLITFFTETVPAYLMDFLLYLRGKRRRYVKLQSKLSAMRSALQPFTSKSWVFRSDRAQALAAALSPADRARFPCHPADIQWQPYLAACNRGVIQYLLKSD